MNGNQKSTNSRPNTDEISVINLLIQTNDWIRYLWVRWYILLIAGVVGGALGLMYSMFRQPQYTATTSFVVEAGSGAGGGSRYAGVASMLGINLGGLGSEGLFEGDNILELYKSNRMIRESLLTKSVADTNQLLIDLYLTINGMNEDWNEKPDLKNLDFAVSSSMLSPDAVRLRDSITLRVVNHITKNALVVGRPEKKSNLVEIQVVSNDETFSKEFNNALVQYVSDFYIRSKTQKSNRNINVLQHKTDSVRAVLTGAIATSAQVLDATPNINPARQAQRTTPMQQAQFTAQANKEILTQLIQNLELAKMSMLQEQPLIQIVDEPIYPLAKESLGKVKGIIFGGFLLVVFCIAYLVVQRIYRQAASEKIF